MEKLRRRRFGENVIRWTEFVVVYSHNTSIVFHPLNVGLHHDMLSYRRKRCLGEVRMGGDNRTADGRFGEQRTRLKDVNVKASIALQLGTALSEDVVNANKARTLGKND